MKFKVDPIFFFSYLYKVTEEIKDKISKSAYYKLLGNTPEGFVMVHNKVLEDLKDFDNWKSFKHNVNYILEKNIDICISEDYNDGII
jgi:hypothetical protein